MTIYHLITVVGMMLRHPVESTVVLALMVFFLARCLDAFSDARQNHTVAIEKERMEESKSSDSADRDNLESSRNDEFIHPFQLQSALPVVEEGDTLVCEPDLFFRRMPTPTASVSTPIMGRRRAHPLPDRLDFSFTNMPLTPILSPSLSVCSSTSGSSVSTELETLARRRHSRVEDMVRQFETVSSSTGPQRRYSISCDARPLAQSPKPNIRNRTFGFQPVVGTWEKRIADARKLEPAGKTNNINASSFME
ncbi:hypothetical protein EC973_005692 [Apophysomyces ossiformis]|uniref:Uncharacterized protein n=1 Tax=Apophysomyces ossiformis TaxID=679940 RepID=A0A8H7ES12_9FUNG|nr:hypothetical protein EC973_005692 [Apophysomyces ossiformis]